MIIQPNEPSLTVTFNKAELEYIMKITQEYQGHYDTEESDTDHEIRQQLFVAVSIALEYNIRPNKVIKRTPKYTKG